MPMSGSLAHTAIPSSVPAQSQKSNNSLMSTDTHRQIANDIWSICNLLRGPYKRNEYRKVILPLTVLRRFDCLLTPTREQVLNEYESIKSKPETVVRTLLEKQAGYPFYNLSKLEFGKLIDDA